MKKTHIIFLLLIIFTLFLLYHHTLKFDLIWDTKQFVHHSILLTNQYPLFYAFKYGYIHEQFGFKGQSFYYRPIVNLSFMIEKKIWGLQNINLRLTNITIFSLSIIFLFVFLKVSGKSDFFSISATTLFALSPLNVDNIVWVVGRCDLFLLLWGILTLLFFHYSIIKNRNRYLFYFISSFFYILGMFSKETFLFFIPLLVIYEIVERKKVSIFYHMSIIGITLFYFILKNIILGIGNLNVLISPKILDNFQKVVSVMGYYFRILFFPFNFDKINFVNNVTVFNYLILGVVSIGFFVFLVFKSKNKAEIIIPISIIFIFLFPYILLSFTTLWPFRISSRYMMMSFLGITWLFLLYISRLKMAIRYLIVTLLLVSFIPTLLIHTYPYRNEIDFWQDAYKLNPRNSAVLLLLAQRYYEIEDDISAYFYLKKAIKFKMRRMTTIRIIILLARLEYYRSDYSKVFDWLGYIKGEISPDMQYHVNTLKAKVYVSEGSFEVAEKILKQEIEKYREKKETYTELYKMYVGFNEWEKAILLEYEIRNKFPGTQNINTDRIKAQFNSFSTKQKLGFYVAHNNFKAAVSLVESQKKGNLERKLKMAELYYKYGKPKKSGEIIDQILLHHPEDFRILNTLGLFYLRKLKRAESALLYFNKSVEINPNQPKILELINFLSGLIV